MEYSFDLVKNQVEDEILPDGLREFPDSFISERVKYKQIPITGKPLKIKNHFFGRYEIIDEDGKKVYDAKGMDEANYIVCSYMPNIYIIMVPENEKIVIKAVTSYEKYIKEVFQKIVRRAYSGSQDHDTADRIAHEILRDNGYSGYFELG